MNDKTRRNNCFDARLHTVLSDFSSHHQQSITVTANWTENVIKRKSLGRRTRKDAKEDVEFSKKQSRHHYSVFDRSDVEAMAVDGIADTAPLFMASGNSGGSENGVMSTASNSLPATVKKQ